MATIVVGISDFKASQNSSDVLITYALGSCIAVVVYDPHVRVGGMLHFMLPNAALDADKARENPCMFADTGIPLLFKACYQLGAEKKRMIVKIAGRRQSILNDTNFFGSGRKILPQFEKFSEEQCIYRQRRYWTKLQPHRQSWHCRRPVHG